MDEGLQRASRRKRKRRNDPNNGANQIHSDYDDDSKDEDYNDGPDQKPTQRRRTSNERLPLAAKAILQKWFMENIEHPFPMSNEKRKLEMQCDGLVSYKQINAWFVNERQRNPAFNHRLPKKVKRQSLAQKEDTKTSASAVDFDDPPVSPIVVDTPSAPEQSSPPLKPSPPMPVSNIAIPMQVDSSSFTMSPGRERTIGFLPPVDETDEL